MHRALRGAGPLSDAEKVRVEVALSTVFLAHGNAFILHQRGLFETGAYNGQEALVRIYFRSPLARSYWARHRNEGHDAKYVALLDKIVAAVEAERATTEDTHA
jgi:hypothetical protein